jgi:beta-glucanase (GH16 family)
MKLFSYLTAISSCLLLACAGVKQAGLLAPLASAPLADTSGVFETKPNWAEEFNYTGAPDTTNWTYDLGGSGWGNHELQNYTRDSSNVKVTGGCLVVTARKGISADKQYSSARLVSKNKGNFLYGRVEVRAQLPAGRGTWPAIWMLPTDWAYGGWPKSGEFDIMEHVGYDLDNVHVTAHTEKYYFKINTQKSGTLKVPGATTGFHLYRADWTPDAIRGYVDDQLVLTFANEGTGYQVWPFDKRFHLLLNVAVGGDWGGQQGVDSAAFPTSMLVDYIRVYNMKE